MSTIKYDGDNDESPQQMPEVSLMQTPVQAEAELQDLSSLKTDSFEGSDDEDIVIAQSNSIDESAKKIDTVHPILKKTLKKDTFIKDSETSEEKEDSPLIQKSKPLIVKKDDPPV